ncbi:peptidase inhibitor i9 domain-containing protein [Purpureocillium lavendulum]|uniref:Peptidase inhibitor i9 domain-containing protein n=1 Tax=Purpureocillium lavendulum TaxID=1247861 RepID=A0AB34FYZ1_9HYPO|nr:peptidase inhibitor i9 domain-containing protein [Purpureocillium lavendulum]
MPCYIVSTSRFDAVVAETALSRREFIYIAVADALLDDSGFADALRPSSRSSAKKHAKDQGGTIGYEYSLIKGFSVECPNDAVNTLESHEHVKAVERDGQMHTQ